MPRVTCSDTGSQDRKQTYIQVFNQPCSHCVCGLTSGEGWIHRTTLHWSCMLLCVRYAHDAHKSRILCLCNAGYAKIGYDMIIIHLSWLLCRNVHT